MHMGLYKSKKVKESPGKICKTSSTSFHQKESSRTFWYPKNLTLRSAHYRATFKVNSFLPRNNERNCLRKVVFCYFTRNQHSKKASNSVHMNKSKPTESHIMFVSASKHNTYSSNPGGGNPSQHRDRAMRNGCHKMRTRPGGLVEVASTEHKVEHTNHP